MNKNRNIDGSAFIYKNSMIKSVTINKTKDKLNGFNKYNDNSNNNYHNDINSNKTVTNFSSSNESVSPSSTSNASHSSSSATPPSFSNDHKPFSLSRQRLNNNFYLGKNDRNEVLRMCNIFC
jgi:hypothetical protein